MFTVGTGLVFVNKCVQILIICPHDYSVNNSTVQVDPHSDSLYNRVVKPKNTALQKIYRNNAVSQKQIQEHLVAET